MREKKTWGEWKEGRKGRGPDREKDDKEKTNGEHKKT